MVEYTLYTAVTESPGNVAGPRQYGAAALRSPGGLGHNPPHGYTLLRHQDDLEKDLLQPRPLLRVRQPLYTMNHMFHERIFLVTNKSFSAFVSDNYDLPMPYS